MWVFHCLVGRWCGGDRCSWCCNMTASVFCAGIGICAPDCRNSLQATTALLPSLSTLDALETHQKWLTMLWSGWGERLGASIISRGRDNRRSSAGEQTTMMMCVWARRTAKSHVTFTVKVIGPIGFSSTFTSSGADESLPCCPPVTLPVLHGAGCGHLRVLPTQNCVSHKLASLFDGVFLHRALSIIFSGIEIPLLRRKKQAHLRIIKTIENLLPPLLTAADEGQGWSTVPCFILTIDACVMIDVWALVRLESMSMKIFFICVPRYAVGGSPPEARMTSSGIDVSMRSSPHFPIEIDVGSIIISFRLQISRKQLQQSTMALRKQHVMPFLLIFTCSKEQVYIKTDQSQLCKWLIVVVLLVVGVLVLATQKIRDKKQRVVCAYFSLTRLNEYSWIKPIAEEINWSLNFWLARQQSPYTT